MSLAQSRLEEIKRKFFDENTTQNAQNSLSSLTPPNKLGPETGETYPNFDDADDYNAQQFKDTVQIDPNLPRAKSNLEFFNETCYVVYVSINNLNQAVNTATWNKRITVTVKNSSKSDSVSVSTIYSYWVFH
jgi:hypothetical protein